MAVGAIPPSAGLAVLSTAVTWRGSELLERSAERRSRHDGLPGAVHYSQCSNGNTTSFGGGR